MRVLDRRTDAVLRAAAAAGERLAEQCDHTFTVPQEPATFAGLQRRPVSYLQRACSVVDLGCKIRGTYFDLFLSSSSLFLLPSFFSSSSHS